MDQTQQSEPTPPPVSPTPAPAVSASSNQILMGILAYIGILIIIPFLMAKDDSFVKFHIKQALILVIVEIAVWILMSVMWQLWQILELVNLAALVLSIVGIVNVVNHKENELPIVGGLAKNFTF